MAAIVVSMLGIIRLASVQPRLKKASISRLLGLPTITMIMRMMTTQTPLLLQLKSMPSTSRYLMRRVNGQSRSRLTAINLLEN